MKVAENMFRQFSMEKVAGYSRLPEMKKDLFDKAYKNHLASIKINKHKFTEDQIYAIEREGSAVVVHFKCLQSFAYYSEDKWVEIF